MKPSFAYVVTFVAVGILLAQGCDKQVQHQPAAARFDLKSGGKIEVRGSQPASASRRDDALVVEAGDWISVSGSVSIKCEKAKVVALVMYRKLKDGKESEIASSSPGTWKCSEGKGTFDCRMSIAKISTTKDCRLAIRMFDGSEWTDVDELANVEVRKR